MKQKVTISVDGEIWEKFSELKWERRKSVSQMVEDLIRESLGRNSSTAEQGFCKPKVEGSSPSSGSKTEKIAELKATGYFNSKPKEDPEPVKETPFQRMRRLHPNDMCMKCRELNKNCKCEG